MGSEAEADLSVVLGEDVAKSRSPGGGVELLAPVVVYAGPNVMET